MLGALNIQKRFNVVTSIVASSKRFFAAAPAAAAAGVKPVKRLICRPTNNLKVGIVGMPNIGKSTMFNCLSMQNVPAENFPFCTIDPNNAVVSVPDPRFEWLKTHFKPKSHVQAVLSITDIAGLVKGASEGKGLGNEFLAHIAAVDAIFHLVRIFPNPPADGNGRQIEHVEGSIDPLRDMEIISYELLAKDEKLLKSTIDRNAKVVQRSADPIKHAQFAAYKKAYELVTNGVDVREGDWNDAEVDALAELGLLSAKPIVYLLNASVEEYLTQHSEWIPKVREWIAKRSPGSTSILFSGDWEADLQLMEPEEKEGYVADSLAESPLHPNAVPLVDMGGSEPSYLQREAVAGATVHKSMLPVIITSGYNALRLIQFFTTGVDEVRSWTIRDGSLAPNAAGVIHSDFEKNFVCAEVTTYDDLVEFGDEELIRKAGRVKTQGKAYLVQDGDNMFFKHTARK